MQHFETLVQWHGLVCVISSNMKFDVHVHGSLAEWRETELERVSIRQGVVIEKVKETWHGKEGSFF